MTILNLVMVASIHCLIIQIKLMDSLYFQIHFIVVRNDRKSCKETPQNPTNLHDFIDNVGPTYSGKIIELLL